MCGRTATMRLFRTRRWVGGVAVAIGCWAGASLAAVPEKPAQSKQQPSEPSERDEFRRFVESLWPQAQARGVSRATFDAAFTDVGLDPKIGALTRKQSEFNQPIWDYL